MEAEPETQRFEHLDVSLSAHMCVYVIPWWYVDLQYPGFQVLIQHDVKAKELVAAVRRPNVHLQQIDDVRFWADGQHNGSLELLLNVISLFENQFISV